MLGYKEVPGGQSDAECTHVVLTLDEYDRMVMGRARAESEAIETKRKAAASIERAKQEAQAQILKDRAETQKTVDSMQETLDGAYREIEYLQNLNENLLRIARERANAERKLNPKKGHTGYVVVSSTEKEYRYKVNRRDFETVMLWETVLQSPYTIDFTEEQARTQMGELTCKGGLIGRLGITANSSSKYEDLCCGPTWEKYKKMNIALQKKLRANYKTGYWEIIISHTKPLGVVPEDMRAR